MNMNKNLIKIEEAADMLGVTKDTLRNWDFSGKLKSIRTKGNHRRYDRNMISNILKENQMSDNNIKGGITEGKTVVYTYVCGDILHIGHLLYLKNSKMLGDFLIVGVLTDEAVMEKKDCPIVPFNERIELVKSLKVVDMAVPQYEYAPYKNIINLKPNILVESTSHDDNLIKNSKNCMEKIGGKVVVFSYYPSQSSTEIKNKIKKVK